MTITRDQLETGYALGMFTHFLVWATYRAFAPLGKRLSTQKRRIIREHVQRHHQSKLKNCVTGSCLNLRSYR